MGTTQDVRSFVSLLREHGALFDIEREVDPVHELGAVLHACEQDGRAALFHHVKGHSIPVLGGTLGSHERIRLALGCKTNAEAYERIRASTEHALRPEIQPGSAPCQEIVHKEVDLTSLPVPTHAPLDAGPFINAGVVVARDPVSGRHNLSFNRMQIFGRDRAGVNINLWRHLLEFFNEAEKAGGGLPFCVAIGVDPVILMAAAFRHPGDEYEIAGGLSGVPVPLARATTCDVLVPAFAEIILEGEIIANERADEGPMAEFTGHYSGTTPQPVAQIRAITHRKDPIFQTIAGASFEHLILGNALTREPVLDAALRRLSPRIAQVHLPPYGSGFTALVSMDDPRPGESRTVAMGALASHVNVKSVIIVDGDVDIFDPVDVLWAVSTRVRWDGDIALVPGAMGNDLDPSSDQAATQAKVIVDAVLGPDRKDRYRKVVYPEMDLREYVGRVEEEET